MPVPRRIRRDIDSADQTGGRRNGRQFPVCGAGRRDSARTAEIFNTDQGSQFTSTEFLKVLVAHEIKISMDGKGAWRDNVFVERLWRTIKYEEVYLRAYASLSEARVGISRYLTYYNGRRPHSSLDRKTPDQAYFNQTMPEAVAA